jgi:Fe2+ or Zn2+ uptake regulation protein
LESPEKKPCNKTCAHSRSGFVSNLPDNESCENLSKDFQNHLICLDCGKELDFDLSIAVPDSFLNSLCGDSS